MRKRGDIYHRGINSAVVGIRISLQAYGVLEERAEEEGISVSRLTKGIIIQYVNNIKGGKSERSGKKGLELHSVNNINILPIYNPVIHKAGDRVLVKRGKRLILMVVPDLDADGHQM